MSKSKTLYWLIDAKTTSIIKWHDTPEEAKAHGDSIAEHTYIIEVAPDGSTKDWIPDGE